MKTQTSKTWNTEQLVHASEALGSAYIPGMNKTKAANGDRWTAQRHIQASMMMGQAYL